MKLNISIRKFNTSHEYHYHDVIFECCMYTSHVLATIAPTYCVVVVSWQVSLAVIQRSRLHLAQ